MGAQTIGLAFDQRGTAAPASAHKGLVSNPVQGDKVMTVNRDAGETIALGFSSDLLFGAAAFMRGKLIAVNEENRQRASAGNAERLIPVSVIGGAGEDHDNVPRLLHLARGLHSGAESAFLLLRGEDNILRPQIDGATCLRCFVAGDRGVSRPALKNRGVKLLQFFVGNRRAAIRVICRRR